MQTRYASQVHTLPALYENSIILNTRVAPFNDVRVRRALNYAVDRAAVARLVGAGAQPTCQTLTPWFTGYDRYCPYTLDPSPSGVWRAPDLTTAHRLITASHTRGTPVTILIFYGAPATAGRYLATLLARLGYPTHIKDVSADPKTGYAKFADSRTKAQAFLFTDYAPYPKASQLIEIYFGCDYFIPNSPLNGNIAEFCDPHLDAQIQNALTADAADSPDVAQRWAQVEKPTGSQPRRERSHAGPDATSLSPRRQGIEIGLDLIPAKRGLKWVCLLDGGHPPCAPPPPVGKGLGQLTPDRPPATPRRRIGSQLLLQGSADAPAAIFPSHPAVLITAGRSWRRERTAASVTRVTGTQRNVWAAPFRPCT